MTAAAVGGSAVAVEPLDGAALHGTKGPAGAVAEAVQVAVAAGEGTVVVVAALDGAAVYRAQRPAAAVTEAVLVGIAAVGGADVGVPPVKGAEGKGPGRRRRKSRFDEDSRSR